MKRLLYYLPFHFVVCLILGICLQYYINFWSYGFLKLLSIIVLLVLILLLIKQKQITTFLSFLSFIFIGISAVFINNDVNYGNYYLTHLKQHSSAVLKIEKVLKSGNYYDKYEAKIIQIDSTKTKGKVLVNIKKDSIKNTLQVDDVYLFKTTFKSLIEPLNPHQFNYKNYLAKQGIHHQIFLENSQLKKLKIPFFSLKGASAKFREIVQKSLKKYNFKPDELAVINALLLGQRQEISKQLISDYSRAGAIHILAVSGLHVGIILLILSWIFKPLEKIKNGRYLKTFLIVLLLWVFAFVAGLSASVVRAVTMFTFLAFGLSFQRKNVVEFSLIASLFFLLIVKPMFLFDVGFQLSYLAVFGIIWIQPKLYNIYKPRFKIIDKLWQLFTVSIAAQAGILPLSLYYFHQFPGLFIASNLIIIPFLSAILIGGFVVILFSLIGILPQFAATFYGFVILLMNSFVSWISSQEQFLLKEISISFILMIALYVFIIYGTRFLMDKSSKKLLYFLVSIVFFQSVFVFERHHKKKKNEFLIYHKSRYSVIGKRIGGKLLVNHTIDSLQFKKMNLMTSYRIGENINQVFDEDFSNIFKFRNETILLVDSLGVYKIKDLENPIVLLQYSPKINLKRLIKTLHPKQIIADGSNYKSYVNRWKITCKKQKTPFHYTGENGAYVLKN